MQIQTGRPSNAIQTEKHSKEANQKKTSFWCCYADEENDQNCANIYNETN